MAVYSHTKKVAFIVVKALQHLGIAAKAIDIKIALKMLTQLQQKFDTCVLIAETKKCLTYSWHKYLTKYFKKRVFWTDTPFTLYDIEDHDIKFLNENWLIITTSQDQLNRFKEKGIDVQQVIGRPLNTFIMDTVLWKYEEKSDVSTEDVHTILKKLKPERDVVKVKKYIACVGYLEPFSIKRKGIDRFLEAVKFIKSELKDRNVHVIMISNVPDDDIIINISYGSLPELYLYEIIYNAILFVFPSKYEGFGLPLAEAMYLGDAIVSTDAPSHNEFYNEIKVQCDNRVHVYVPELRSKIVLYDYKSENLAKAILEMLDRIDNSGIDRQRLRRLRKHITTFAAPSVIQKLVSLVNEVKR